MNNKSDEKNYRLQKLATILQNYKQYAIYGVGKNAETLLLLDIGEKAVFLIDEKKAGQYYYNKKVLTIEEAVLFNIDTIVIAAEPNSSLIIEKRIFNVCLKNRISLLNIYGADVLKYRRKLLVQETDYFRLNENSIRERIVGYDCICFDLFGKNSNNRELWAYKMLRMIVDIAVVLHKTCFLIYENQYIYDDISASDSFVQLDRISCSNYEIAMYDGLLRKKIPIFEKKTLYVGYEDGLGSYMSNNYDIDFLLVKNLESFLYEISDVRIKTKDMLHHRKIIESWAINNYKSTLCDQKNLITSSVSYKKTQNSKKNVCFFSTILPRYDRDAGSKTIMSYLKLFLRKGYKVSIATINDDNLEPYYSELKSLGIIVVQYKNHYSNINTWIADNMGKIGYAIVNYPDAAEVVMPILKVCEIRTLYYGHDLHFFRLRRQFEEKRQEYYKVLSDNMYHKEKRAIELADLVCYPSEDEVDLVKREWKIKNVNIMMPYIYESSKSRPTYIPEDRDGIMFIGSKFAPNQDGINWFVENIYPEVDRELNIPLYIVGGVEVDNSKMNRIFVESFISENELDNLYSKVRLVVVPLRFGAGVKGKVVDALHRGIPIVSTSIGIEGIPDLDGCIRKADTGEEFIRAILEIYNDYETLCHMSVEGAKVIEKNYSEEMAWKSIGFFFDDIE